MTEQAPRGFHPHADQQHPGTGPDADLEPGPGIAEPGGPAGTGVAEVDAVLTELERIDDLPLEEHVGVFERAHESLRSALDPAAGAAPDRSSGDPT